MANHLLRKFGGVLHLKKRLSSHTEIDINNRLNMKLPHLYMEGLGWPITIKNRYLMQR